MSSFVPLHLDIQFVHQSVVHRSLIVHYSNQLIVSQLVRTCFFYLFIHTLSCSSSVMSQRELKGLLEDVPSTSSKPASSSSSSSSSSRASLPSSVSNAVGDTLVPSQTVAMPPLTSPVATDSPTTSSVSPTLPSSTIVSPGNELSQLMTMIRDMNSSVIMLTSDVSAIKNELHVVKSELSIARSVHNVTQTSKNDVSDVDSVSVSSTSSAPSSSSSPPVANSSNDSSPPLPLPSFTRSDVRSQSSNDRPSSQSQVRPVRKDNRPRDSSRDNRREKEHNDQPNEDDITEYASMMDYLRKRERLYPYVNDRFKRLYTGRCTLLSHNGRVNEYYRFGMMVDFTPQLYPPVIYGGSSDILLKLQTNIRISHSSTLTRYIFHRCRFTREEHG